MIRARKGIEAALMDQRKQTGRHGEDIAVSFLIGKGYQIIERNWHCVAGELDLIAADSDTLVFVEVRTRRGSRFGLAEESITAAKQARLIELAQTYLQEKAMPTPRWRIDVVAIRMGRGRPQVNHIENAVGW